MLSHCYTSANVQVVHMRAFIIPYGHLLAFHIDESGFQDAGNVRVVYYQAMEYTLKGLVKSPNAKPTPIHAIGHVLGARVLIVEAMLT